MLVRASLQFQDAPLLSKKHFYNCDSHTGEARPDNRPRREERRGGEEKENMSGDLHRGNQARAKHWPSITSLGLVHDHLRRKMLSHQSTASGPQVPLAGIISGNSELKEEYCLCKGTDDGRPMVSCDYCSNW